MLLVLLLALVPVLAVDAQPYDSAWTIRAGTYSGAAVPIDLSLASRHGRFWRLTRVRDDARVVGWNPSRLPIAVAFHSRLSVSVADSLAFWRILDRMEADLGLDLFEPRGLEHGQDPEDVIVVDIRSMAKDAGKTLVTWSTFGSVYDARVFFRSRDLLQNERVVTHEMMHALGFGHTGAWHSVMNPSLSATSRLTVEDVAYAQVAFAARALGEAADLREQIRFAVSRGLFAPETACDLIELPVRSPGACTSFPCSVPSASCRAGRSTAPWPAR